MLSDLKSSKLDSIYESTDFFGKLFCLIINISIDVVVEITRKKTIYC